MQSIGLRCSRCCVQLTIVNYGRIKICWSGHYIHAFWIDRDRETGTQREIETKTYIGRDIQRQRHTVAETYRRRDIETQRHKDKKHTDRRAQRERQEGKYIQRDMKANIYRETEGQIDRKKEIKEIIRDRYIQIQRLIVKETERRKDRKREKE